MNYGFNKLSCLRHIKSTVNTVTNKTVINSSVCLHMALLEPFCACNIPHQDVRDRMVT